MLLMALLTTFALFAGGDFVHRSRGTVPAAKVGGAAGTAAVAAVAGVTGDLSAWLAAGLAVVGASLAVQAWITRRNERS